MIQSGAVHYYTAMEKELLAKNEKLERDLEEWRDIHGESCDRERELQTAVDLAAKRAHIWKQAAKNARRTSHALAIAAVQNGAK